MRTAKYHFPLWIYVEFNVKAGKRHLVRIMSLVFIHLCAELFSSHSRKMMTPHWGCAYLFRWKSQKSLGKQTNKQKDWQEATGIVYYVLLWEVWQACPLSKGFLPLLVLWLPADTALPRTVSLSLGANEFLGLRFCPCFTLWRPPQWQEHSFTN